MSVTVLDSLALKTQEFHKHSINKSPFANKKIITLAASTPTLVSHQRGKYFSKGFVLLRAYRWQRLTSLFNSSNTLHASNQIPNGIS